MLSHITCLYEEQFQTSGQVLPCPVSQRRCPPSDQEPCQLMVSPERMGASQWHLALLEELRLHGKKDTRPRQATSVSHAWRLLRRDTWPGLAMQPIHGSQKLVCNHSCFSQPTQQSTVDCGWVVVDCMLSGKEES